MPAYPKRDGDREHRVVWEEAHGPIPKGYHVHHRNGDITDNRLENLELMSAGDHTRHHNKNETAEMRFHRTRGWRGKKQPTEMVAKRVASTEWHNKNRPRPLFCHVGHALTPDNVYTNPRTGGRYCRTCKRARDHKYAVARKETIRGSV